MVRPVPHPPRRDKVIAPTRGPGAYSRSLYGSGGGWVVCGFLAGCLGPDSDRRTSSSSASLSMSNSVTSLPPHPRHLNGRPFGPCSRFRMSSTDGREQCGGGHTGKPPAGANLRCARRRRSRVRLVQSRSSAQPCPAARPRTSLNHARTECKGETWMLASPAGASMRRDESTLCLQCWHCH